MASVGLKPAFCKTRNVRNFEVMMTGLELGAGEGRLGMVSGRAGRGKTRTAQWWHAHHESIYLRAITVWRQSELDFLRQLAVECGIKSPPHRKGACFSVIMDELLTRPRPVFVDELEKLPASFLDVIRDLTDLTTAPVILIGEEELVACMRRNRRVWSRVYQALEFEPIGIPDILGYAREAAGLTVAADAAASLQAASGGDFRLVRRAMLHLVQMAHANGTTAVDASMANTAVRSGFAGV